MEIDRIVHILDSSTVNMLSNSQPIRILKRPPNLLSPEQVNGSNGCVKPPPVIKSLQQVTPAFHSSYFKLYSLYIIIKSNVFFHLERARICRSKIEDIWHP